VLARVLRVERASSVQAGKGIEEGFAEIDALVAENRANRDPELERRILRLRHQVGIELMSNRTTDPQWPDLTEAESPEITPAELTPERLRASMLRHGYLLIRGLLDPDEAHRLADEIEQAFQAHEAHEAGEEVSPALYEEFEPEPPFRLAQRGWVNTASGLWGADSPRVMFSALDAMERAGLRQLATEYLGERPAISVDKCTLRRVHPDFLPGNNYSAWHQDGAFLGDVRALNVWLALSRCGDVAPGLDIVPKRLDFIAETGSEGTAFSWSVSEKVAAEVAGDAGIQRPIFEAGDVMLFDELFLHSTAADPGMTQTRYAVETWFFGPSAFPGDYTPLAF
jgi:hypothetical protein